MSSLTSKSKIKIDNGTEYAYAYTANIIDSKISGLSDTANSALTNAESAQTKADTAHTEALTAQTTANEAYQTATTAKTTAESAKDTANSALNASDQAVTKVIIAENYAQEAGTYAFNLATGIDTLVGQLLFKGPFNLSKSSDGKTLTITNPYTITFE